jgi:protein TonB
MSARATKAASRRHDSTLLMATSVVVHGLLVAGYLTSDEAEAQPRVHEQQVEIALEPPPPPPPEQPPVPLPQTAKPQPARAAAPTRARQLALPKADPEAPADPDQVLVPEEPEPTGPVAPEAPPGPAAPAAPPGPPPIKVVEAHEGANYLKNPRPAYPPLALERGWEGAVLLRVRVAPNGSPENVLVAQSSGRDMLDEAAIETVKTWAFVPARSGQTAIAGWVTVPIVFKIQ